MEEIEAEFALKPEFGEWRNGNDRMKRKVRWEDTQRMERVIRSYWYSMIMHLWHKYHWGQKRLTRFYSMVQERYNTAMEMYLACRDQTDGTASGMIEETINAIKEIGVSV